MCLYISYKLMCLYFSQIATAVDFVAASLIIILVFMCDQIQPHDFHISSYINIIVNVSKNGKYISAKSYEIQRRRD